MSLNPRPLPGRPPTATWASGSSDWFSSVWGSRLNEAFTQQILKPLALEEELGFRPWTPPAVGEPSLQSGSWKQREVVATVECLDAVDLSKEKSMIHSHGHSGVLRDMQVFSGSLFGVYRLTQTWLEAFKGEDTIFHSATIQKFWTRQRLPSDTTWALTWDTPSRQGSTAGDRWSRSGVGHLGFTGTSIWVDLKTDVIGVLLTNTAHWPGDPKRPMLNKLRRSVYDASQSQGKHIQRAVHRAAAFGRKVWGGETTVKRIAYLIGVCGTAMGSLAGQLVALGTMSEAAMRCLPSNVYKVGGVGGSNA